MPSTKITALPALTTPSSNAQNTVFVVVDLDTGTPTTKKLSLQNLDLFVDNVGSVAFAQANAAFDKANSANVLAQNAYNFANTIPAGAAYTHANGAFNKANSANVLAQNAYNAANSANTFDFTSIVTSPGFYGDSISVTSINLAANGRVISASNIAITGFANSTYATSAFDKANSANTLAQTGFDKANSANVLAQQAYNAANTVGATFSQAAFDKANSANVLAQSAFNKGNSANVLAQAAFDKANTDNTSISILGGTFGNSSIVPVIVVEANGRISAVSNTTISLSATAVTGVMNLTQGGSNNITYTTGAILTSNGTAFVSLSNTGTAGTYANASHVPVITTDAYGRVSAVTNTAITANANTLSGTTLAGTVTGSNLSSVGTLTTLTVSGNTTVGNLIISTGGTITGDAAAGNVSANAVGYMSMPQNNLTSNYVITLADQGKHLYYNVSTNNIVYIPTTSNVAFPIGATIAIISRTSSSANVTITPNTGVSLFLAGNTTSAGRNVTTYGMATLVHVSANTWFVNGTGVSAL